MGLADSSGGPLTTALLRSGGTTRLLQNTVHVKLDVQGPAVPARSAGGGTTKLLADMTMASMVGAKLRGQHTGALVWQRRGWRLHVCFFCSCTGWALELSRVQQCLPAACPASLLILCCSCCRCAGAAPLLAGR